MNCFQRIRLATPLVLLACILSACTSTKITGSWKAQETIRPVASVLVMVRIEGETLRRMAEDRFTAALKDWNVNSVASYDIFAETAELEKERVAAKSRELSLEGILIVTVLEQKQTEETYMGYFGGPYPYGYHNLRADPFFYRPHYRWWPSYYGYGYSTPHTYSRESTSVRLESALYRSAGLDLIWSAITETSYIDGLEGKLDEIARKVAGEMAQDNAI